MSESLDPGEVQQLETLINHHSLQEVLQGLALACHNRAVGLAKGDASVAKAWITLADVISLAAIKAEGL